MTFASNIAVDDVTFSANLTCVSVGKPTLPETFEGDVFLTRTYSCSCSFASRYRGIHADVTVYIFAHLHTALCTEGNMLDMS